MERSAAQKRLIGFILVLAVVNVAYRLVYLTGTSRSAALFVGIPTLLAVGLALLPRSRSATGMLMKGSILALLIACVVLPEGLLCLLFAAPLAALIAVVVGGAVDWSRRRGRGDGTGLMAVTLPLLLFSMEGLVGSPFNQHDAATATATIDASPAAVRAALAATPAFAVDPPTFLSLGFNRPVQATGSGLDVGDWRVIAFTGAARDDQPAGLLACTAKRPHGAQAEMRLTIAESVPGRVVFRVDHDGTMLPRWADLERAVVTWRPAGDGDTRVEWRLEYRRLLFPTAYFGPLQRFGMGQAARYLLDAVVEHPLR